MFTMISKRVDKVYIYRYSRITLTNKLQLGHKNNQKCSYLQAPTAEQVEEAEAKEKVRRHHTDLNIVFCVVKFNFLCGSFVIRVTVICSVVISAAIRLCFATCLLLLNLNTFSTTGYCK